ncbi:MerR family transcriptional regulator [Ruminococcus sp. OA3]|uniref:MerR family transcriptional regulator n=1 Tax=Ruminococcus sp. OA3 TaxID=2914164 RepID=UPI001F06375E|nr:methyltransferase domain-containing protein [Ruminococcus sp. OA3]MCH1982953.1 MerR family transcriptional regulator [Ruminococcus sp. OA3]
MEQSKYYTSGEFARMARVSVRTIRFYDKQNVLKPSYVNDYGKRFYTDSDLARLQQILLLKYLGFSLDDIRNMTINDSDSHILINSLNLQLKLIRDRIEQLQMVEKAIQDTTSVIETDHYIDWSQMLELIHLTNMEKSLKSQYQNATNISARINLHTLYTRNKQGWFPWIFAQCNLRPGMRVLELGCGNGALWTENLKSIPAGIEVILSDISEGMIRDARRAIGPGDRRFTFEVFDCQQIPYPDASFDLVIANHLLFYCEDVPKACSGIARVLKSGGRLVCSTYSANHMKEINELVRRFDDRITLSADRLYEQFGLENGGKLLQSYFDDVQTLIYEDSLLVDTPEPLIEYILSCHGNQNQYILDRYKEFRLFVEKKTRKGFRITKEAGIFSCKFISKNT